MKVFGKKILSAITVSMAIALMSCSTPAADYSVPSNPLNVRADWGEDGSITVRWDNTSDSSLWGVELTAEPADGVFANPVYLKNVNSFKTGFLNEGTYYKFTVKSMNKNLSTSSGSSSVPVKFIKNYDWYETPITEDGKPATKTTTGSILFGRFPSTLLADSNVIIDENSYVIKGGINYYRGNDGEYYAKIEKKVGSNTVVKYYKVEPVKWKIVKTDFQYSGTKKACLLMSENVISGERFYLSGNDYSSPYRTIDGKPAWGNNYQCSTIRAYLNGLSWEQKKTASSSQETISEFVNNGFLQGVFTQEAQKKILVTTVVNDGNSTTDTAGKVEKITTGFWSSSTEDKIFLPSVYEISSLFASGTTSTSASEARRKVATDYAVGKVYHYNSDFKTATFWLRSPAPDGLNGNTTKDSKWIRCVSPVGTLYNSFNEDRSIEGLVPAFCMEL